MDDRDAVVVIGVAVPAEHHCSEAQFADRDARTADHACLHAPVLSDRLPGMPVTVILAAADFTPGVDRAARRRRRVRARLRDRVRDPVGGELSGPAAPGPETSELGTRAARDRQPARESLQRHQLRGRRDADRPRGPRASRALRGRARPLRRCGSGPRPTTRSPTTRNRSWRSCASTATGGSAPLEAIQLDESQASSWRDRFAKKVDRRREVTRACLRGRWTRADWIVFGVLTAVVLVALAGGLFLARRRGQEEGEQQRLRPTRTWFVVAIFAWLADHGACSARCARSATRPDGEAADRALARRQTIPAARPAVRRHAAGRRRDLGPAPRVRRGTRRRARRGRGDPVGGRGSRGGVEPRRRRLAPGARRVPDALRLRGARRSRCSSTACCARCSGVRSRSSCCRSSSTSCGTPAPTRSTHSSDAATLGIVALFVAVFGGIGGVPARAAGRRPDPHVPRAARSAARGRPSSGRRGEAPHTPSRASWFAVDPGDVDDVKACHPGDDGKLPPRGATVRMVLTPHLRHVVSVDVVDDVAAERDAA